MVTRSFFFALLSLISATVIGQEKSKMTLIEFPAAQTYSIQVDFYDGETVNFSHSKAYLESIFPQLKDLKLVKKGGEIIVRIQAEEPIELSAIRNNEDYATEVRRQQRLEPLPTHTPANHITYYQPMTVKVESAGKVLFQMRMIGEAKLRALSANKSSPDIPTGFVVNNYFLKSHKPERDEERKNVLNNLRYLKVHADALVD